LTKKPCPLLFTLSTAPRGQIEPLVALKAIVSELGAELGRAVGPGDMGKVMRVVKTRLTGKAEMRQVPAAEKAALAA
jgi:uncharacterized protein